LLLTEHKTLDDDEREEMIRYVSTSAESAFKLLDNLLTWAQSQSGNIEFFPEDIDLSHTVAETVESVQGQATEKEISVISEVSEPMEIFGDENMLSMVLRNLVSNALKFTHSDGEVRINTQRREGDVLVSVSDTGVGISEAALSKLFKVSQNASTIGTNNEKGTGLGLILCKEFIEQHGGSIWAESEVGKGTTFYFSIPTK
jgi:signal transduction histidine kinase